MTGTARDDLYRCSGLVKQCGKIKGGCSGAEDPDFFAFKAIQIGVLVAVSDEFLRQPGQLFGKICVVGQADRDNHALRVEHFTAAQGNAETRAFSANALDEFLFKLRHEAALEFETISAEDFQRHRRANAGVLQSLLLAIGLEREPSVRIKKTGGESFRLEVHALWHVTDPHVHRPAEDPKVNSGRIEMSSDGQAVRACPNDCHVASFHIYILDELLMFGDKRSASKSTRHTLMTGGTNFGQRACFQIKLFVLLSFHAF